MCAYIREDGITWLIHKQLYTLIWQILQSCITMVYFICKRHHNASPGLNELNKTYIIHLDYKMTVWLTTLFLNGNDEIETNSSEKNRLWGCFVAIPVCLWVAFQFLRYILNNIYLEIDLEGWAWHWPVTPFKMFGWKRFIIIKAKYQIDFWNILKS